jgi:glycosyltransferase involved in cell wall biosynthesis
VKILNIFNHYLEQGGEARAVEAISKSLSQVVDLERCDFFSTDWVGANAPAFWKQAIWMLHNPASLKKIRQWQHRFKPGLWLVHNVFPVGSAAIYSEAKRLDVPIIQYVHNFRPFSVNGYLWAGDRLALGGLKKNYWQEIRYGAWQNSRAKTAWLACALWLMHARRLWDSVKAWIALSHFTRDKFISAGVPAEDIYTLRHFWKLRPKGENNADGTHFLYLGRLTEAKGILVLLNAWEILERRLGTRAPRLLIGGHGPLRSFVISRTERMRSVNFTGELKGEAKHRAFEAARAVIVPSLCWEALGLVVYEAYDYSRPVLAASSGGLSEIVVDGETGLLHGAGNADQLAHQVIQLERETEAREGMGRQGRLWLERNADEAKWLRCFCEIADHALACK